MSTNFSALQKFNGLMNTMLKNNYTGYLYQQGDVLASSDDTWGRVRSQDMMITLQWLLEYHPGDQADMLLDNMKMLHDAGLNWEDWYNKWAYFGQGMDEDLNLLNVNLTNDNYHYEHGVNVGQGQQDPSMKATILTLSRFQSSGCRTQIYA